MSTMWMVQPASATLLQLLLLAASLANAPAAHAQPPPTNVRPPVPPSPPPFAPDFLNVDRNVVLSNTSSWNFYVLHVRESYTQGFRLLLDLDFAVINASEVRGTYASSSPVDVLCADLASTAWGGRDFSSEQDTCSDMSWCSPYAVGLLYWNRVQMPWHRQYFTNTAHAFTYAILACSLPGSLTVCHSALDSMPLCAFRALANCVCVPGRAYL